MTRIVYRDIAPGAKESAVPEMTDLQPFCNLADLGREITPPPVATGELNCWRLDGTFDIAPDDMSGTWGAWSKSMSGEDGVFENPVVLTLTLPELFSSVGISFKFDPYGPVWCNALTIQWYRDAALLSEADYQPTAWEYSCINEVRNYNKLVITFRAMSKPYRYLKLWEPVYGITREFTGSELRVVNLFQGVSPISEEMEIGTLDFTLSSEDPVPFMFQRKQPLEAYHNDGLQGVSYISKSKRTGRSLYDIESSGLIGLLDESTHRGGIYTDILFPELVAEIMGPFAYEIDPALESAHLSGWLPIASRRENLEQAAFAGGAAVSTAGSKLVRIFPPRTEATASFDSERVYYGSDIETASLVTAVGVTEHKYTKGTETQELFNDTLSGTAEIAFSAPMHTLTITGGTILESGDNYAVITGTGAAVILSGKNYAHTTRVVSIKNPDMAAGDIENVIEVTDATLVSADNASQVAQRVYDKYQRREKVNAEVVFHGEMPGDKVAISTEFDGEKTGTILSIDADLARKKIGKVVVLCEGGIT